MTESRLNLLKENIGLFAILIFLMLWTTCNGAWQLLIPTQEIQGYHNYLASAFQHGQLHLLIEPSKELLALSNPYDPSQNSCCGIQRLHDASLYEGHYYLYFSPVPALLIFLPFHVLTGLYLPENLFAATSCLVGTYFMIKTTAFFIDTKVLQAIPKIVRQLLLFGFAILPGTLYFLRRVLVYESTIAFGFMLTMTSFYSTIWLTRKLKSSKDEILLRPYIIGCGLLISLMVWTRPNLFPYAIIFAAYILIVMKNFSTNKLLSYSLFFSFPILVALLMATYNYMRFNSFIEFGMSHMLFGTNMQGVSLFSFKYMPVALYGYLATMPTFNYTFPFVHLNALVLPGTFDFEYWSEPLIGIFGLPIFWVILNWRIRFSKLWFSQNAEKITGLLSALGVLLMLSTNTGTNGRYTMEFFPILLILLFPLVVNCFCRSTNKLHNYNLDLKPLIRSLFIASVSIQLLVSFTGYGDTFKNTSPGQFRFLEGIFRIPLEWIGLIFK